MNWLAHVYLSDPDVESRLGNILADVVKGKARKNLPQGILRGIASHQAIDAFTDCHPRVHHCRQFIRDDLRRYSGILIDVFFDHILARNWQCYSQQLLDDFLAEVYGSFRAYRGSIPLLARGLIERMASEDWLGSYRYLDGIARVLAGISRRLSQPVELEKAMGDLTEHYEMFAGHFAVFFEELKGSLVRQESKAQERK